MDDERAPLNFSWNIGIVLIYQQVLFLCKYCFSPIHSVLLQNDGRDDTKPLGLPEGPVSSAWCTVKVQ